MTNNILTKDLIVVDHMVDVYIEDGYLDEKSRTFQKKGFPILLLSIIIPYSLLIEILTF